MNELQIFNYNDMPIRTIEKDGEIWWVLKDVCGVLGITNHSNVAARLDKDEKALHLVEDPTGKAQQTSIVNEPGLYSVILRADKPEAKDFKRWVTHEVIPSIRKTGSYSLTAPRTPALPDGVTFSSAVGFMRLTRRVMLDMGASPFDVGMMIKQTCEAISFPVPPALNQQIRGQLDLFGRPGLEVPQ